MTPCSGQMKTRGQHAASFQELFPIGFPHFLFKTSPNRCQAEVLDPGFPGDGLSELLSGPSSMSAAHFASQGLKAGALQRVCYSYHQIYMYSHLYT